MSLQDDLHTTGLEEEIRQLQSDVEECKEKLYEFADLVKEFDDSRDPLILVALVKLARQIV